MTSRLGADPPFGPFVLSTLPILMYHGIDEGFRGRLAPLNVSSSLLTGHLETLRATGYLLSGVSEALDAIDGGDHRPRVALTFDDAYEGFAEVVLPILASHHVRATVYVPVAHIGDKATWLTEPPAAGARVMSWASLYDVARSGVEIGSHGWDHRPMDVLNPDSARQMLIRSRRELIDSLQIPVRSFCYPHGYSSPSLRAAVQSSSYDNAVVIGHRVYALQTDRFRMERLMVRPDTSPSDLVRNVARLRAATVARVKSRLESPWRLARRASRLLPMRELT